MSQPLPIATLCDGMRPLAKSRAVNMEADKAEYLRTALERQKHHRQVDHFELWASRMLGKPMCLFEGDTNIVTRRERLRSMILDRHLGGKALCGPEKNAGPETWQSLFERFYGMDLCEGGSEYVSQDEVTEIDEA